MKNKGGGTVVRHIRQRLYAILPEGVRDLVGGLLKAAATPADLSEAMGTAFGGLFRRTANETRREVPGERKPFRRPPEENRGAAEPEGRSGRADALRSFQGFVGRLRNRDAAAIRRARQVTATITGAFGPVEAGSSQPDASPSRRLIDEAEQLVTKDAAGSLEGREKMQCVQGMLAVLARAVLIQRHMDKPPISNRIM